MVVLLVLGRALPLKRGFGCARCRRCRGGGRRAGSLGLGSGRDDTGRLCRSPRARHPLWRRLRIHDGVVLFVCVCVYVSFRC